MKSRALRLLVCRNVFVFALLGCCLTATAGQGVPRKRKNLTREDRGRWREVLRWPRGCDEDYEGSYSETETYGGVEFHALGRGLYLVEVVCDGGGIQPSTLFMLYDESRPRRARLLKLKEFESGERGAGRRLSYPPVRAMTKFDARRRELFLMGKYDAMGTCGLFVRYKFTARGSPRAVEVREQTNCGDPEGSPDTSRWPRKRL